MAERLLKWLLIACGVACVLGLPGLYMPRSWMASAHEWLGMGEFPEGILAEYMARLCSGLYALYGGIVLILATDVRRYGPVITAQAIMILCLALSGGFFAWGTRVPRWWVVADISACIVYCGGTLVLQHYMRRAARQELPRHIREEQP